MGQLGFFDADRRFVKTIGSGNFSIDYDKAVAVAARGFRSRICVRGARGRPLSAAAQARRPPIPINPRESLNRRVGINQGQKHMLKISRSLHLRDGNYLEVMTSAIPSFFRGPKHN